jgi:hypothetical protein
LAALLLSLQAYVIDVISVIGVIDVIGVITFCKGPLFFFFNKNLKEKNIIHNHVIDVIDVIEFLMYLTK